MNDKKINITNKARHLLSLLYSFFRGKVVEVSSYLFRIAAKWTILLHIFRAISRCLESRYLLVLYIVCLEFIVVLILAITASSFWSFDNRRIDQYEKVCILYLAVFGESERCTEVLAEGNMLVTFQNNETSGHFFKITHSPQDGIHLDLNVQFFNYKDYLSVMIFVFSIAIYNFLLLQTQVRIFIKEIVWMNLSIAGLGFLVFFFGQAWLDNWLFIDSALRSPWVAIIVTIVTMYLFLMWFGRYQRLNRKQLIEALIGGISLLGFSLFLKYGVVENRISQQVYIDFSEELPGFDAGFYKADKNQYSQMNKVLSRIQKAIAEYGLEANTLVVEGHTSPEQIKDQNPCGRDPELCSKWRSYRIDKAVSDKQGNLIPLKSNIEYFFNSNIELGFLRAYVVWDFLNRQRTEKLPTIQRIYPVSVSHFYPSPKKTRRVIVRLIKQ
ncbi:MAG: hypothetical protein RRB13_06725 [bacterium]|nr:hypothetical protein [bacterium]